MNKSFDVFLSHNSKDKPAVREVAEALRGRGLKVWLDEWELIPGRPWQEALEEIIETTQSAAVLVGKDGLGPWQDEEMRGCLSEFVDRKLPMIPVLLPSAPEAPRLPFFLKRFTWVDLRGGLTEEGIDLLQWGITGKRPVRDDLKETPPPRPPLLVPPGRSSTSLPATLPTEDQAAMVSTHMPRQGSLVEPRRTLLMASVAALVLLTVFAALFGWLWQTTPRDSRQDEQQTEVVVVHVRTGLRLDASEPPTAVNLAPEKPAPQSASLLTSTRQEMQSLTDLYLYVNGKKVIQRRFDNRSDALVEHRVGFEIEAGNADIHVRVGPPGEETLFTLEGNFPDGSIRTLGIHLPGKGQPSVSLN